MIVKCAYDKLVPIAELRPNPKNPNQHPEEQIELLAKIMRVQGVRSPIVVSNQSGLMTKGHGRLIAALRNDWTEFPVDFQDYDTLESEYQDMVADNKIAELSQTDMSLILKDVLDFPADFNFELLGIPNFEVPLSPMLPQAEASEQDLSEVDQADQSQIDTLPEDALDQLPEKIEPRVKPGEMYQLGRHRLICGDSSKKSTLSKLTDGEKLDCIVTDPPYGLSQEPDPREVMQHWIAGDKYEHLSSGFMGKSWDSFVPGPQFWTNFSSVLKPGSHVMAFCATRTWDLMSIALRFAGFQNRDTIASFGGPPGVAWVYGSGFPKSLDVSKAIDKMHGAQREVVGSAKGARNGNGQNIDYGSFASADTNGDYDLTAPATEDAKTWQGWGTALKPAWETVLVFRKPLDGTVAENVLKHGTGALNIDGSRIAAGDLQALQKNWDRMQSQSAEEGRNAMNGGLKQIDLSDRKPEGRWPANVLLDEEAAAVLDEQSGVLKSGVFKERKTKGIWQSDCTDQAVTGNQGGDSGGASRFFYTAKASKGERNAGLEGMPEKTVSRRATCNGESNVPSKGMERFSTQMQNHHPTVKPISIMQYLIKMICPDGGKILEPFGGSGTTLIAAEKLHKTCYVVEMNPEYCDIILARWEFVSGLKAQKIGEKVNA